MPHPDTATALGSRIALLAFILVAFLATAFLVPPRPAAAFICADGYATYRTFYYSNAQHTTQVGECVQTCSGTTCTGEKTAYYVAVESGCCDL
jgi:hypothetical protein